MLVDVALLLGLGVGHDATGHGTCNLTYQNINTIGGGDHDVGMLVLLAGLRQPSLMIVTVEMLYELHLSIDREPVGMDIQRTHKDRDHESLIMKIRVLLDFLDDHNLSIGRSHHEFVGVAVEIADRTTVEVEGHQPCCAKDEGE